MESNAYAGIDLHIHSTYSDGSFTPSEIFDMARELSLSAIAITDHDTVEGNKAARLLPPVKGVRWLTGVEISAKPPEDFRLSGSIHILGYGIDIENRQLNQLLDVLKQARNSRIPEIVSRLNDSGMAINLKEVMEYVGDGTAGRPHVASVLVKKGYAVSVDDAFNRFLVKGTPGYVKKTQLTVRSVIETIISAGGIPVLAHPGLIDLKNSDLLSLIRELIASGLKGVEAYYTHHTKEMTAMLLSIASSLNLLATGGSDFHGDLIPSVKMGSGEGNLFVPPQVYQQLISSIKNK